MTRAEMIAIAHQGLLLGPSPLLRHQPGARRRTIEGGVMTYWGPAGAALNKVAMVGPGPAATLAQILPLAETFFGPESGGFGIVVEADAGHPVEAELRAAGWKVFEDEPVLVAPASAAAPPLPAGLEVLPVRDAGGRRDLTHVTAAGFGAPTAEGGTELPADAFDSFTPSLACALDPEVALLVGYVDGRAVSSAMMWMSGPIAGITGVATVPAYRRRGLGTALTWAAVREGAARGCRYATLAALGASYDLYRKMGFVHVCNHRAYQPHQG
jgi:ribosomal protein S18 acetylase RimI-like enzyme